VKSDFMMAINQVCHERQLPTDIVLEAVEVALISAYKRNFGGNQSITAKIDNNSGEPLIFIEKVVIDAAVEMINNRLPGLMPRKYPPEHNRVIWFRLRVHQNTLDVLRPKQQNR
jgi:hypothetical protein